MAQRFFGHFGPDASPSTRNVRAKMLEEEHNTEQEEIPCETLVFSNLDVANSFAFKQQSEDSAISVSNRSSPVNLPVDDDDDGAAADPSPINTRIEEIGKKAQDIIDKINQSWAMDQQVMSSFEEKLKQKAKEMCQQVKDQMYEYYEEQSQRMETQLTGLSEVLQRCSHLSRDLQGASQMLSAINKGLQQSSDQ